MQMSTGAARWLNIYLGFHNNYIGAGQPPIFTTMKDIANASFIGGTVLRSVEALPPDVAADVQAQQTAKLEEWCEKPFKEWTISESGFGTVQLALKAAAERGALSVHRYTAELLRLFEMET